ncbi:MAG: glycosyltransferase family 4 protein [Alphaproteobacteria bacterium]|nr:glycosyltransferase family 4 protein [Alphaproteobacteria bacterium]
MSASNLSAGRLAGLAARSGPLTGPLTGALTRSGRVLLITNQFPPNHGGSASVYAALVRQSDGRVVVLTSSSDYRSGGEIAGWRQHDGQVPGLIRRIPLLRTLLAPPATRGVMARLAALGGDLVLRLAVLTRVVLLLHRERIDGVCIGELLASGWLVPALRLVSRVPISVYIHGEEILTQDDYDPGHRRAARTMAAADRVLVVSRFSRAAVLRLLPRGAEAKVALIANGVDTARFQPGPADPALAARYGLAGCFVFVTVSRLLEKKGVDTAIRALAAILPRHPECRLLVVGTGPMETGLRALAHTLGLTGHVIFAGAVADAELADHYRLGDAFVLANRALPNGDTEGFGLVLLEASACGLAVIGGRDGGTGSAVIDGETGLLVDGQSAAAVATAMARLRVNDAERRRMGRAGAGFAAQSGWQEKTRDFLGLCLGEV